MKVENDLGLNEKVKVVVLGEKRVLFYGNKIRRLTFFIVFAFDTSSLRINIYVQQIVGKI